VVLGSVERRYRKVDLVLLLGPVATHYVCHGEKSGCVRFRQKPWYERRLMFLHLRQAMRITLLSAEYGLKAPYYSSSKVTASSDV
jgi:hypothetical protein